MGTYQRSNLESRFAVSLPFGTANARFAVSVCCPDRKRGLLVGISSGIMLNCFMSRELIPDFIGFRTRGGHARNLQLNFICGPARHIGTGLSCWNAIVAKCDLFFFFFFLLFLSEILRAPSQNNFLCKGR